MCVFIYLKHIYNYKDHFYLRSRKHTSLTVSIRTSCTYIFEWPL